MHQISVNITILHLRISPKATVDEVLGARMHCAVGF